MNDLGAFRALVRAGAASLEASRQRIDDLNVYPVPDGDTGTNLALTVRALVESVEATEASDRGELAREVTRAALLGARGNSGVILSQIIRGAADVLGASERIDPAAVAAAFRGAADAAYGAVREPVEGTILTVIRELADEAEAQAQAQEDMPLEDLFRALVESGERSVASTRELLDVLRDAGVVDAGGAGLLELVRGMAAGLAGEPLPEPPPGELAIGLDAVHQELSRYRYCTLFVIEGEDLDLRALEAELERIGDSLLVVGDPSAIKVHVHTDDPGAALTLGVAAGTVDGVEIANMHRQTVAREGRLLETLPGGTTTGDACDVVAVVVGTGNRALFESLGARKIVEGGQTMNPSAAQLVEAIEAVPADEVILLPNNSNVVLTAQQAAPLAGKVVEVVATDSLQRGLAAMVAYDATRPAGANAEAMREALAGVATGEVTVATRDARLNGISVHEGAYLGLAEGEAVASGPSFDEVARAVVERLLAEPRDLITFLVGAEQPRLEALLERLAKDHPEVEVEVQPGGQPHYPLLISAE